MKTQNDWYIVSDLRVLYDIKKPIYGIDALCQYPDGSIKRANLSIHRYIDMAIDEYLALRGLDYSDPLIRAILIGKPPYVTKLTIKRMTFPWDKRKDKSGVELHYSIPYDEYLRREDALSQYLGTI